MKLIPLRDGTFTKVDNRFFARLLALGPWRLSTRGYVVRGTRRKGQRYRVIHLHREVCRLAGLPKRPHTDHKNLDKRDNRLRNLRPATESQNLANQCVHVNNKSGFKGVSWHPASSRWMARIKHRGKTTYLGIFNDPVAAAKVYNKAARRLFGRFARLNKV